MLDVYCFDVDDTLDCAGGPVQVHHLINLRKDGHIIGLCGNVHHFCARVPEWWNIISFTLNFDGGPWGCPSKAQQLEIFRKLTHKKAEHYYMIGNIAGVSGASDDKGAAEKAGWYFIKESDFAAQMGRQYAGV